MSKNFQTVRAAQDTIRRVRTYGGFVRRQPGSGWAGETTANGRLELTAMAGASA